MRKVIFFGMWGGLEGWRGKNGNERESWVGAPWGPAVDFARSDGERAIEKERSARERGDTKIDEAECRVDGEVEEDERRRRNDDSI